MKCPECQGEVPALHFYCPHCRAEMPLKATAEIAYAAEKADQSEQKERAERAALLGHHGSQLHSRRLYEIGWQAMQWIVTLGIFGGAFISYQRINWQNAAQRMNTATVNAVQGVEATEAPAKAARRPSRSTKPGKK